MTDWFPNALVATFLKAAPQVRREALQAGLEKIAEAQELGAKLGIEAAAHKLPLQPIRDVHLNKEIENVVLAPGGDAIYSYILGVVSMLVLLIACINFMNLTVGLSTSRSKEVGIRNGCSARTSDAPVLVRVVSLERPGAGVRLRSGAPFFADV